MLIKDTQNDINEAYRTQNITMTRYQKLIQWSRHQQARGVSPKHVNRKAGKLNIALSDDSQSAVKDAMDEWKDDNGFIRQSLWTNIIANIVNSMTKHYCNDQDKIANLYTKKGSAMKQLAEP